MITVGRYESLPTLAEAVWREQGARAEDFAALRAMLPVAAASLDPEVRPADYPPLPDLPPVALPICCRLD